MKLCIFDMGGVVCDNTRVSPMIVEHLGITSEEFYSLAYKAQLQLLQTGEIKVEEFWRRFEEGFEQKIEEDLWQKFFQPVRIPGTVAIIEELKKHVRVVAGTNTIDSHYKIHLDQRDYDLFDKVYASHQIGYAKPDLDFYRWILKEEGCDDFGQVLFIDDALVNVEAAKELGLYAIHFTNPEDLRAQLPWELLK